MSIEDRFKLLAESEGISREKFAMKAGIPYTRLVNIFSGRAKVRFEEIELIGNAWPEYRFWVAYGEELPEAGQISPMTKAAQAELKTQGKAG